MAQGCLKCLKYTMCVANFFCFMSGVALLALGGYMMLYLQMTVLTTKLHHSLYLSNMLLISGIIITCISFLGFLGALKENRCLLLTFFLLLFLLMLVELTAACLLLMYEKEIVGFVADDLDKSLKKAKESGNSTTVLREWDLLQTKLQCCGVHNASDWGKIVPDSCCEGECNGSNIWKQDCLETLKTLFEENFLSTGITVIVLCIIEVLGMCFAMTLFCHITRSGLGYRL